MSASKSAGLLALVRAKNLALMTGHTWFYNNSLRWLKQALDR